MNNKALYWIALGVFALGLNSEYQKGNLPLAHRVADRAEAVYSQVAARAEQTLALARLMTGSQHSSVDATLAQQQAEVERVVAQHQAELEKLPASREENPGGANAVLASLATDLEGSDAAPTASQREVLDLYEKGIARFEAKWKGFAAGPFATLARRLEKLGVKAGDD